MTEQKVEEFAERLVRIWGAAEDRSRSLDYFKGEETGEYLFRLWVTDRVRLEVGVRDEGPSMGRRFFQLLEWSGPTGPNRNSLLGKLHVWADTGELTDAPHPSYIGDVIEKFADFSARYLSFFQRGCWLSGCPIEASAHEKAEWMQEFTKEEIESWDLKI